MSKKTFFLAFIFLFLLGSTGFSLNEFPCACCAGKVDPAGGGCCPEKPSRAPSLKACCGENALEEKVYFLPPTENSGSCNVLAFVFQPPGRPYRFSETTQGILTAAEENAPSVSLQDLVLRC